MRERDPVAEEPGARALVDQLGAAGAEKLEHGVDVVNRVGDVVHAGPAPGDELRDRRLGVLRLEQLDPRVADEHVGGAEALALVAAFELRAEEPLVGRDRLVEVLDREAEVVDTAPGHRRDASD